MKSAPSAAALGLLASDPLCSPSHFFGLCRGSVVDRDVVSAALQMSSHGVTHDAETDEGNFAHI